MATKATALKFDGAVQFVALTTPVTASLRGREGFSFSAWVKVGLGSIYPSQKAYVEYQNHPSMFRTRFAMVPIKNKLRFELAVVDGWGHTNYDVAYNFDNRWHHVFFGARINSENPIFQIFIDGVQRASGTLIKPVEVNAISNTEPKGVYLAKSMGTQDVDFSSQPFSSAWHGAISDIAIYDQLLNETETTALASSRDTPPLDNENLVYYWPLSEGTDEGVGPTTISEIRSDTGQTAVLYDRRIDSGSANSTLWTLDRPFLGNGVVDTTAPSAPTWATNTASVTTETSLQAIWNPASDNIAVQRYEVQISEFNNFSSYVSKEIIADAPVNFAGASSFETRPDMATGNVLASIERIGNGVVARTTSDAFRGAHSLHIQCTPASGHTESGATIRLVSFNLRQGEFFTASLWLKGMSNLGFTFTNDKLFFRLRYESGFTQTAYPTEPVTLTSDWQFVEFETLLSTANQKLIAIEIVATTGTGLAVPTGFLLDEIHVVQGTEPLKFSPTTSPMLFFDDLAPNTNYYLRVRAIDAANNTGAYSATQSRTTLALGDVELPEPPTSISVTSLSHTGFTLSWTPSISIDADGYKLDLSYNPDFTNFVPGFQDLDVGDVTSKAFNTGAPLITYYARLRTYDTSGNESVDTPTLMVQTTPQPDLTPPNIVVMREATSVASRAFTANWFPGVDDTGVVNYLLDVSSDPTYAVIDTDYHSISTGNVESFRVTNLAPNTVYYYRVRAQDAAGNISLYSNSTIVSTLSPTIGEGGFIDTTIYTLQDAYVDADNVSSNYGLEPELFVGDVNDYITYLQFDTSFILGSLEGASLALYVTEASNEPLTIRAIEGTFNQSELTYTTRPTMSGDSIEFTPSIVDEWVFIDISSLLTEGATSYIIEIASDSIDTARFSSQEGEFAPYLVATSDPSVATELQTLDVTVLDGQRVNWFTNPNFETDTSGWTAANASVLSRTNTNPYSGEWHLVATNNGMVEDQGVKSALIPTEEDEYWTFSAYVRCDDGPKNVTLRVEEFNDDPGSLVASGTKSVIIDETFRRVFMTYKVSHSSTAFIQWQISIDGAQASVLEIDNALAEKSQYVGAYFDGNRNEARWAGAANASTSIMNAGKVDFELTYIGDSNENNTVRLLIQKENESESISFDEVNENIVYSRSIKEINGTVGPSYTNYNVLSNPSFAVSADGWTEISTATIERSEAQYYEGLGSLEVLVGGDIGAGVASELIQATEEEFWSGRVMVMAPPGLEVQARITALDNALDVIDSSPSIVGVSTLFGNNTWQSHKVTWQLPTATAFVCLEIVAANDESGAFLIDNAQLHKGRHNNPYRDGTFADASWENEPHNSPTSFTLLPETMYHITAEVSDEDGVVNSINDKGLISETITTAPAYDNVLTVVSLVAMPELHRLNVVASYLGDDNGNSNALIEWRRNDLTSWSVAPTVYDRAARQVRANIGDLNAGTTYVVRVTFTDADGIYGANPIFVTQTTTVSAGSPEVSSTISFGGFLLMGRPDGKIGVISQDALGHPTRRVQIQSLPRVDGAIEFDNLWGERRISMQGFVAGDTRADLDDTANALRVALARRQQQLIIDTLSTHGRFFYATCDSLAIAEVAGENFRHLIWDAEFVCADPFAYSLQETMVSQVTVMNNDTLSFVNDGDVTIAPILTIKTTHSLPVNVSVTNVTTGQTIIPLTSFEIADTMVIDNQRLSVQLNNTNVDYNGGFFELAPGNNIIRFKVTSASGIPSALVSARWRHRYL